MATLGIAMLGAPATVQTQTAQFQAGDQARQNAESGYYVALSLIRAGGLNAARAREGETILVGDAGDGFQFDLVNRQQFDFSAPAQTVTAGGNLTGITLPDDGSLPRLNGWFFIDGVEHRYDSFEADAGVLTNVRAVDGRAEIVIPTGNNGLRSGDRLDVVVQGTFGGIEQTLVRQIEIRPSRCALPWGGEIEVGQRVTAFRESSPVCGSSCQSEVRVCEETGLAATSSPLVFDQVVELSGSHQASSCAVQACNCTAPWGGTVQHGTSVVAYSASSVAFGQSCSSVSQIRTCTDGTLSGSGSFTHRGCIVEEPASCTTPWLSRVDHDSSVTAYSTPSVASGQSCSSVSQIRTCRNGTLSGSFANASCTVQQAASCTTPWGTALASGSSVTAYSTSTVAPGQTCLSQTRTCTNGTLSGSYSNASCTVQRAVQPPSPPVQPPSPPVQPPPAQQAASCTTPWGAAVASGSSVTAYSTSSVPYGDGRSCSAFSQIRTCTNGTLSGSYANASCEGERGHLPGQWKGVCAYTHNRLGGCDIHAVGGFVAHSNACPPGYVWEHVAARFSGRNEHWVGTCIRQGQMPARNTEILYAHVNGWYGLCAYTHNSSTCDRRVVYPMREDKTCPQGFSFRHVAARYLGRNEWWVGTCMADRTGTRVLPAESGVLRGLCAYQHNRNDCGHVLLHPASSKFVCGNNHALGMHGEHFIPTPFSARFNGRNETHTNTCLQP